MPLSRLSTSHFVTQIHLRLDKSKLLSITFIFKSASEEAMDLIEILGRIGDLDFAAGVSFLFF